MYTNSGTDNMALGYTLGRDSNNGYNNGNGFFGGDGWWGFLIIALLFGFGGWGNGFGGGWGNGANGAAQFTDAALQRGFDNQTVVGKLDGINSGICSLGYDQLAQMNNLGMQVANGFNGVARDMCTGFANVTAGINENRFAAQQCCCDTIRAIDNSRFDTQAGFTALGNQLSSCCCDIRSGLKDIQYQNATDTCALQTTMLNNTRDIIDNQNAGFRSVLDYLCQEKIADLQAENQSLKLSASQAAQNTFIQNAMNSQTDYLIGRIAPYPIPAFQVSPPYYVGGYGMYGNNGSGCGCNNGCGCNSGCGC